MAAKAYKGVVCYVGHDQELLDGRSIEGGWHYAVVEDENGNEWPDPDHKLVCEEDGYRDATADDVSHHDKHHQRYVIIAPGGNIGEPHNAESVEATHRHLDELEARIEEQGIDAHERDHILTTPGQIAGARRWLSTLGGE